MSLPVLRPHQQRNLEQLNAEVRARRDPVLVAPCGYGKGTLLSVIVHNVTKLGYRVIFAVHGKSLVVDMSERVTRLGVKHGVLLGGERRERWHPVQVASIDTLHRMSHPPEADLIIIDEAHMATSPTWGKALSRYPDARLIGATATPIGPNGRGLKGLFDSMVLGPSEEELIALKDLVGSRVYQAKAIDMKGVGKTGGDFNAKQLAAVCDKVKLVGDIVTHWKKYAEGRKTAAFAVDKAHANHICEQFNAAGVPWAYVDAETPMGDSEDPEPGTRAHIWRDLDHGNLMGVSSVGCISIGWDHPPVSCLIAARPTASLGLWRQMLGRGSRPYPGKQDFIVLDHAGNTRRHGDGMDGRPPWGLFEFSPPWSLEGNAIRESDGDKVPSIAQCRNSYKWPDLRNEPDHKPEPIINGVQMPCYGNFRAGTRDCPYCGIPLKVTARKIEVEAGELTEIVRAEPVRIDASGSREYHSDLMRTATDKNYKPAWVGLHFKHRYGFWPPKKWETDWLSRELQKEMAGV